MKKNIILVATVLLLLSVAFSQTTSLEKDLKKQNIDTTAQKSWKTGGVVSFNLSQISLKNWTSGGENSLSWNGLISLFANYKSGNSSWDNTIDIGYGLTKKGSDENFIKSDDKIDFSSKYGKKASKNWYYAGLLNLKTQMTAGYKMPNDSVKISAPFAPAYILGAVGIDYKPSDKFSFYASPLTAKTTIVTDKRLSNLGAFGVDSSKSIRNEFGGYTKLVLKLNIMKNITFQTKLDLFTNYLNNPQNIDVNWETLLSMKINKFFSANITTNLIYDDDIDIPQDTNNDGTIDKTGPATQFKEVFGLGITYKF
ncbi:MAG: DUF3078 domain-containing protein [Candidatus Marinimicrobia bacterium]|nr:DUF3078 domain-containing protein [Candidatus Neomarinimicrobiota bacterium]